MRLVIKLGTSLLTNEHGKLTVPFLRGVVAQAAAIHKSGHEVVVVSSGAVAAGRSEITLEREKKNIPYRQALAAVGQGVLMKTYHDFFGEHGVVVSQALLTNYDFVNRENFLNTKNVFDLMLKAGVIPIVNENDVTTIAELKFGDNDVLSAKTAAMVSADLLVIMTDVDGLFLEDPKNNPGAKLFSVVEKVDDSIRALAGGARSSRSMGGMVTKLEAADYVTSVGIPMFIVNGRRANILQDVVEFFRKSMSEKTHQQEQKLGTIFIPRVNRMESQKKWLRPKIQKAAWVEVDSGAAKALTSSGKSLLPSGISAVHGTFKRGDVVLVKTNEGAEIAYGQVNYGSVELDKIKKHRSDEIEQLLGFSFEEEVIHRDRMALTA
ncbi:MAG: glutamate 5-kinase [Patescibacteria group bacterium]